MALVNVPAMPTVNRAAYRKSDALLVIGVGGLMMGIQPRRPDLSTHEMLRLEINTGHARGTLVWCASLGGAGSPELPLVGTLKAACEASPVIMVLQLSYAL